MEPIDDYDINRIDSIEDENTNKECKQNVPAEAVVNINQNDYYHKNDIERDSINEFDKETLDLLLQELIGNIEAKDRVFHIINLILKNLLQYPDEMKYRELKYENKTIENLINTYGVLDFLYFIGFEDVISENNSKSLLILDINTNIIELAWQMTSLIMNEYSYDSSNKNVEKKTENTNINDTFKNSDSKVFSYIRNKNTDKFVDLKQILKQTGSMRGGHDTIEDKSEKKNSNLSDNNSTSKISVNPSENTIINNSYQMKNQNQNQKSVREILKETSNIRMKHTQSINRNVIHTIDSMNSNKYGSNISNLSNKEFIELANNNKNNINVNNKNEPISKDSLDTIGKEALRLSNVFRKTHNLPELKWDPEIWKISIIHSKNMAEGKVPFGHAGFNKRVNSLPYSFYQANENVFMCSGFDERTVAENAVQGWINSPGHRKNLLSNTNYCAIACYKSGWNTYHLTQIFTRR